MEAQGISQAELGRRVGISQSAIHRLTTGENYGSKHLHRIARELGTTPAYLTGEVDDPDEGAPPPPPAPRHQQVMLPVTLPTQAALAAAFQGVLRASQDMGEAELARELARRLPTVLRLAEGAIVEPASAGAYDPPELEPALDDAHRERRRA